MINKIAIGFFCGIAFILGCNVFFGTPFAESIKGLGSILAISAFVSIISNDIHEGRKEAAKEAIEEYRKENQAADNRS